MCFFFWVEVGDYYIIVNFVGEVVSGCLFMVRVRDLDEEFEEIEGEEL